MLRISNHRSLSRYNHRSRSYQSASPPPSAGESGFKALRMRLREAAHQADAGQLAELRRSALYKECYEWGRRQAQAASRSTGPRSADLGARNAAAVQTICYALDAFVDFSRHYDVQATPEDCSVPSTAADIEHAFLKQIRSTHRDKLLSKFRESLRANSEQRRAAVLSAIDGTLLDRLGAAGIIPTAGDLDETKAWRRQSDPALALNEAELLALVDYLNSATGTFNVVNGAAIASAYYGEHALHSRIGVFSAALAGAISKLCDHPFFARRDIICYKGLRLNSLDAPFRLAVLEEACAKGGLVAFPNVLSASCDPEHSYARKKFEDGYTLECMITMRRGFYADPFHDVDTMGEQEILGPARQRFRVTGKSSFKVFDWGGEKPQELDVARYELTPAMQ